MSENEEDKVFTLYEPIVLFKSNKHPGEVVETKALSYVRYPLLTYVHSLPRSCLQNENFKPTLSGVQLEAVVFAGQAHTVILPDGLRQGFVIADGAGIGKGRENEAIIVDNFYKGRTKSIWLSASKDLIYDAKRDMDDLLKYEKTKIPIMKLPRDFTPIKQATGTLFVTYSSLGGITSDKSFEPSRLRFGTRFDQICSWMGDNFEGVIILDEAHKAKNFKLTNDEKSSQAGDYVSEIQAKFPLARVVYVSATLASEVKDIMYMNRLGLWGNGSYFRTGYDFMSRIENRGLAASELIALDLKERGLLMCRHLSLDGVIFEAETAIADAPDIKLYNQCTEMWVLMLNAVQDLVSEDRRRAKILYSTYWNQHQNFFRSLCVGLKVKGAVRIAKKAVLEGKAVVIGLQSTGEAAFKTFSKNAFDVEENKFSTTGVLLQSFLEDQLEFSSIDLGLVHFEKRMLSLGMGYGKRKPSPEKKVVKPLLLKKLKVDSTSQETLTDSEDSESESWSLSTRLSESSSESSSEDENEPESVDFDFEEGDTRSTIASMFKFLIPRLNRRFGNPLDMLKKRLGGASKVVEMTGRIFVPKYKKGKLVLQKRNPAFNQKEQDRFNNGDVDYAIISDACSTGISLHSNRTFKNQKKRLHIILEIPWSANSAIQQMGRTNRSNQCHKPEYVLLMSIVPGELRFASAVAARIQNMGALSKGDAKSDSTSAWSNYLLNHKTGDKAISMVISCVYDQDDELNFFSESDSKERSAIVDALHEVNIINSDGVLNKTVLSIDKFLNRVLGIKLPIQDTLMQILTTAIEKCTQDDKDMEIYDGGVEELSSVLKGRPTLAGLESFQTKLQTTIKMFEIVVDDSLPWIELQHKSEKLVFFAATRGVHGHKEVIAVTKVPLTSDPTRFTIEVLAPVIRESVNHQVTYLAKNGFVKVKSDEAELLWNKSISLLKSGNCLERFWFGKCSDKDCFHPRTTKTCHVIVDQCLSLWDSVIPLLPHRHVRIVRTNIEGKGIIGIYVPMKSYMRIKLMLMAI